MRGLTITQLGGDHPVPANPAATAVLSPASPTPACARCGGWGPAGPDDADLPDDDYYVPDDLHYPTDPDVPGGPVVMTAQEWLDVELDEALGRARSSRVEEFEWQEWHSVDQDEAERAMLRLDAPAWVFLPPGGDLAAALEHTRPQAMSPMALIELVKATSRLAGWAEAIKTTTIASFLRQRRAEHAEAPRPSQVDTRGRPIDPERSWHAELALALGVSKDTVARRAATALRLTSTLRATHTALKCGALTFGKALAIAEATADLTDDAARAVEAHVLKRAAAQSHKNLLESLRRQVAKHTVAKDADNHRAAAAERTCKIVPLADGMAGLWIVHTADKIQQIWVTIQAIATLAKRGTPTPPPDATDGSTTPSGTAGATPGQPTTLAAASGNDTGGNGAVSADATTISGDLATTDSGTTATPTRGTTPGTGSTTTPSDGNTTDNTADTDRLTPMDVRSTTAPPDTLPNTGPRETGSATASRAEPSPDTAAGERVKDDRTAEQRRADVAADLFEHILRNGLDWLGRRLPDQHRRRPHIEVVVPASTLLGLDDDPAELTGYGPIPATMARRIAHDGTWRRLLTDPTNGTVLEAATTRHDPGTLVTETLLARHPVCAWPGCNHTSRDCDRDHTTPYTQTGTTSLTGLAPYCEYHHVIKDTPAWGWTSTSHPDGSITLTTPTGQRL